MRHRVGAAALAVIGGLLVVVAVFMPSWWEGPIHIAGRVIHGKTVHISMLRTTGCNSGDGTCMGLDVGAAFRAAGLLTLLLATATALVSLAMAIKAWSHAVTAVVYARFALIGSAATVIGASFFIAMLPTRFEEIAVGLSPYGFFTGTAAMALASVLALRRRAPSRQLAEPVDVRELLSTDMLRPAMLGPEPKMGRHGAVLSEEPSFSAPSARRFRPLYEVQAEQAMQAQQQAMQQQAMQQQAMQQQAMQQQAMQQQAMQGGHGGPVNGAFAAAPPSGQFAPAGGAFAAPPSGAYAMANGSFAPSPGGAYGPPPNGAYGPPPNGAYGPPPSGAYGPPPNGAYGPPPNGAYGPPPNGAYGPPPNGAYGSPPNGAYAPSPSDAYAPPNPSYGPASGAYSPGYPAASPAPPASPDYPPARGSYPPGGGIGGGGHAAASPTDSADFLRAGAMDSASSLAAMAAVDSISSLSAADDDDDEPDPGDAIETANLSPVTDRADALPHDATDSSWRVDPPELPAGAPVATRAASEVDPGFDQPTTPSQMSMAAMLAQQDAAGRHPTEVSDSLASLEAQQGADEYESLDEDLDAVRAGSSSGVTSVETTGDAEPGQDSRTGENDSGVFFRKESAASVGRAAISRPPTATTSASLAALAALSKPALITMAPTVARKMPPSRGGEPAVAAAVAAAVAPDADVAPPPPAAAAAGGTAPACPHCEAPMAWADKHLRYYCGSCRMYF